MTYFCWVILIPMIQPKFIGFALLFALPFSSHFFAPMFTRFLFALIGLCFSFDLLAQTLTISSAANSGTYSYSAGTLTVSGTSNIQASQIQTWLASGDLSIVGSTSALTVNVNQAITSTTSGSNLIIGTLTNTGAVTISSAISVAGSLTVYGGNIAINQDLTSTLSGSDILLQATGAISLAASTVIQTANGDITFRSNASGTAVVTPNSTTGAITLNSGSSLLSTGGNITLGGNFDGAQGIALYAATNRTGGAPGVLISDATIAAEDGNINIYGKCTSSYDDGIRLQANISTTGAGHIGIYGEAFGGLLDATTDVWFGGITFITNSSTIETENGNINIEGVLTNTQSNSTYALNFYRSVYTSGVDTRDIQIISKTGDIQITADRGTTAAGGMGHSSWGDIYFGSPLNSAWTATGDVKFSYSSFVGAGVKGYKIKTSGAVTYEPTATSFVNAQTFPYNSYYTLAAEASSLFLGKDGNTANISVASAVSIAGPIDIRGGYVEVDGNLTSTAAGDIFIKGVAGTNPSIEVQSGKTITKTAGVGTLTLQGHGRVLNKGSITTSGNGVLNVIFWSDFDNDNDDGGVAQQGTISTNGGHVWLGGSNTNGGSYTWNGLEVGNGPSIGTTNFNSNAMDIYGNITTNGGDFLAWAGSSTASGGIDGIASDGSGDIVSVGSGNIVLITDMVYGSTGAAMYFTQSGGTFTLVPFEGSFNAAFNWNPVVQTYIGSTADDYNLQGANFDWLGIGELNSISRLTIGYYNGMLNNGTPVEFTNSSDITFNTATTAAGAVELYGGALALNANLNTTNTSTGHILLQGTTITGTGNIGLAAGRTATINVSANSSYAGLISGTGSGLTKLGAGLLTLTKDHTYSGATNINAGDLQVGTGGDLNTASSGTIETTSGVVVANGSKLILSPNDNVTFAAPISGAGGVEIKGTSGSYYNAFLTATPATIASNSSVLEVLTRITAGLQRGGAISTGSGEVAGAYHKNYNASANTATLQFQQYDGTFTKCVFVRLSQSGTNVQISANTSIYSGAAYRSGNTLGTDMSSSPSLQMGLATSAGAAGYGISKVYMSGKVNFTGVLTYTGNTVLSNTITNGTSPTTHYYVSKGTQEITDVSSAFPAASAVVNNGLVIFNRATAITIASDLSGTEEVLQVGAPITLSGTCTHTGITTIDLNKSLIVGNGSTVGSITGNIVNYGTLTFSRSDNSSYPGIISGSGTLVKSGAGEHTLTGLQTFTGATTISGGKLIISRDVPAFSSSSVSGAGELVIQPTTTSFTNAVSYPIAGITVGSIGGLTLGKSTNTSDITIASATTISGPVTLYGGNINLNQNINTSGAAALGDILCKASGDVILAASRSITTSGGDIILWANSDNANSAGSVALRSLSSIVTGSNSVTGGHVWIGGGSNGGTWNGLAVGAGYAVPGTTFTPSNGGSGITAGIYLERCSISTFGGNVEILGNAAAAGQAITSYGTISIDAMAGTIDMEGNATNSAMTNISGILFGMHDISIASNITLASSAAGNAITITGFARGTGEAIGLSGTLTALSTGTGNIIFNGTSYGSGTAIRIGNYYHGKLNAYAASGSITFNGGIKGLQVSAAQINGITTGHSKLNIGQGGGIASSSSPVIFTGDVLSIAADGIAVNTSGSLTIQPSSNSFTNTLTYPITSLTVANTITGLTLGKATNLTGITIGSATSIAGPIAIYGASIALSNALTSSNATTGNISLNGTTLTGSSTITLQTGRTLTFNLSSTTTFAGVISGTSLNVVKDGAGVLALTGSNTPDFATLTISAGTYRLNSNQQLTLSGAFTNNGTFVMSDGATFKPANSGTSVAGSGTFTVQKYLAGNSSTWNSTNSGRFWYMGIPVISAPRSSFGNYDINTNRLFSYNETTKTYTNITDNAAALSSGTGYVHRRSTNDTLTFTGVGANGLYGGDMNLTGLTRTSGSSVGFNLISNPYMAYLDWDAVTKTNVEPTYYLRSHNSTANDITALITYNASTGLESNNSSISNSVDFSYLAPLQAIWVRVGTAASTGSLAMTRSMLSHQTGNTGLKSSTIFPTLARVNLVDGPRFDQMLVFLNQDMTNGVDQYDSEKMFASGVPQIYTMAAGKKLVMNGLNSNKKKISVPVYLELPESKVYNLQLADYNLEDGLILLEDKLEGTIQDFTFNDSYAFYANSGVLQNRFVLHFYAPDATITAQGPSNTWAAEEGSYSEGTNVEITADSKGKVQISLNQPETEKVDGIVQVTDANGRIVHSGALEGAVTTIELNVPSGIYYLTVQSGNMIENKKVFIQE